MIEQFPTQNCIAFPVSGIQTDLDANNASSEPTNDVGTKDVSPLVVYEAGCSLYAIKSYHAQDLDELQLEIGDIIELDMTPELDDDYWLKGTSRSWGKRNGQQGFFPKDHVVLHDPNQAKAPIYVPKKESQKKAEELEKPEPVPKGTMVTVLYPFEPTKQDELLLTVGAKIVVTECPEGGWWKGYSGIEDKNPITGWFPANLVKVPEPAAKEADPRPPPMGEFPAKEKLEVPTIERKVSWFKRLRSPTDSLGSESEADRRGRGSTVSQRGTVMEANESENDLRPDIPAKKETIYEIKPLILDDANSVNSSRASIIVPRGTGIEAAFAADAGAVRPRMRAESIMNQRSTIFVQGVLTNDQIMQGALDEKIQDKFSPAVYKLLPDLEKKRLAVIWELLQTERDFVRDLSIIIEVLIFDLALHETNEQHALNWSKKYANFVCKH